jgi:vacuolar-type H+-ATPase catalytic subunit A/Vma1
MKKEEPNTINDWLNKHGDPEIAKQVEKEAKELHEQETLEEYYLSSIKSVLSCNNDYQAIRLMEIYFDRKSQEQRMYSEEDVIEIIKQYAFEEHLITSNKPDVWFEQFKKK